MRSEKEIIIMIAMHCDVKLEFLKLSCVLFHSTSLLESYQIRVL
jgi:hypothetical protein